MTYPDVTVPPLSIAPTTEGYVERIAGLCLSSRHRSGRHIRPVTLTIVTDAGDVHRHLTVEDVCAIKTWAEQYISAHERAMYPEEDSSGIYHGLAREAAE